MEKILKENMKRNTHYLATWKYNGRQWFRTCKIKEKEKLKSLKIKGENNYANM